MNVCINFEDFRAVMRPTDPRDLEGYFRRLANVGKQPEATPQCANEVIRELRFPNGTGSYVQRETREFRAETHTRRTTREIIISDVRNPESRWHGWAEHAFCQHRLDHNSICLLLKSKSFES